MAARRTQADKATTTKATAPAAGDTAPEGVTTLADATAPTAADPPPSNDGAKSVTLTAPSGSKVTVREDLAVKLKAAGYKK